MVGGDIISDFKRDIALNIIHQRSGLGIGLDIGTSKDLDLIHFLHGSGSGHHIIVDDELAWHLELRHLAQLSRVGEVAGQSGGGGHFGRYEIDLTVLGAGSALEVTVEGP